MFQFAFVTPLFAFIQPTPAFTPLFKLPPTNAHAGPKHRQAQRSYSPLSSMVHFFLSLCQASKTHRFRARAEGAYAPSFAFGKIHPYHSAGAEWPKPEERPAKFQDARVTPQSAAIQPTPATTPLAKAPPTNASLFPHVFAR